MTVLVERLDPVPDPADAAVRLSHLPWLMWLDSAVDPKHLGRWSIMSAHPWKMLRAYGAVTEQRHAHDRAWSGVPGDMLQVLERELAPLRAEPLPGQPPFAGGALGFLGYDWGRVLERRPAARYDDLAMPGAMFGLYDWAIVVGPRRGRLLAGEYRVPGHGRRARHGWPRERIEQVRDGSHSRRSSGHPDRASSPRHRPIAPSRRHIPCSPWRTRKRSAFVPRSPGGAT